MLSLELMLRFMPVAAAVVLTVIALLAARGRHGWLAGVFVAGLVAIAAAAWQQHRFESQMPAVASAAAGRADAERAADRTLIKQLEQRLAHPQLTARGRTIDDQTAARLKDYLRWFAGHRVIVSSPPDDIEAFDYANRLVSVLQDAGWDARGPETTQIFGEQPSPRVSIYANGMQQPEAAKVLADAFRKYNVPYENRIAPSDTVPPPEGVELFVPPKAAPPETASGTAQPRH